MNGCVLHEKPPVLCLVNFIPWKSFVCPCHCHSSRVRFLWIHAWSSTIQSSLRLNPTCSVPPSLPTTTHCSPSLPCTPCFLSLQNLLVFENSESQHLFHLCLVSLLFYAHSYLCFSSPINSASSYTFHGLFVRTG